MKFHIGLILFICGRTWGNIVNRVTVVDHEDYIVGVITETVKQIESKEWCNLKIPDTQPIPIDVTILGWQAKGSVQYTNGFVVSIQGMHILHQDVIRRVDLNKDGVAEAIIEGTLTMRDVAVGFDVQVDIEDGVHHYTTKYVYPTVEIAFVIHKIISSDAISLTVKGDISERQSNLPDFLPSDKISDALTSMFDARIFIEDMQSWATEVFQPIAQDVVTHRIKFPEICYHT